MTKRFQVTRPRISAFLRQPVLNARLVEDKPRLSLEQPAFLWYEVRILIYIDDARSCSKVVPQGLGMPVMHQMRKLTCEHSV